MKKQRNSKIEALRILSICGVIAIHYIKPDLGGMLSAPQFPDFSWLFSNAVLAFAVPLVNCFVIITGYFSLESDKLRIDKIGRLACITAFYGLLAFVLACGFRICDFSLKILVLEILPYFEGKRWFVETYIILLLLMPFINIVLNRLPRKEYQLLLGIWMGLFVLWYSVGLSAPLLDDGYGIINFLTLYMIGGYLKKYDAGKCIAHLKRHGLLIYIGSSALTFLLSYFINPYGYAFITNIVGSTAIFCFFVGSKPSHNRYINVASGAAFDVYLLHSDQYTSHLLISDCLMGKIVADTPLVILHMPIAIIAIYAAGMLIWFVREKIFTHTLYRLPVLHKVIIIAPKEIK